MLSAKSSELRMALEIALVDLVQKLKEPSVSALVQKIERLKTAIETGKPFQDSVPQPAAGPQKPEPVQTRTAAPEQPGSPGVTRDAGLDTAALLQKAFLAEEVPVNPETEKLF